MRKCLCGSVIKKGEIENIKADLNSYHENLKFPNEIENEGELLFLDVNITRNLDSSFNISV